MSTDDMTSWLGLRFDIPQRLFKSNFLRGLWRLLCFFFIIFRTKWKSWVNDKVSSWLDLFEFLQNLLPFLFWFHVKSNNLLIFSMSTLTLQIENFSIDTFRILFCLWIMVQDKISNFRLCLFENFSFRLLQEVLRAKIFRKYCAAQRIHYWRS